MSYKNTKHKLRVLRTQINETEGDILSEEAIAYKIEGDRILVNRDEYKNKKHYSLGTSLVSPEIYQVSELSHVIYKNWEIDLGEIVLDWLPFIRTALIADGDLQISKSGLFYDYDDEETWGENYELYFRTNQFFKISDIEGETDESFKRVKLIYGFKMDVKVVPTTKFKLLVRLTNPEIYT